MVSSRKTPRDIARSMAERTRAPRRDDHGGRSGDAQTGGAHSSGAHSSSSWRRETFTLPRVEARAKAREWFERFPKAAYMTEIEFWRELDDDVIEFTIRRLPTAD
jgi:hypothetical protein